MLKIHAYLFLFLLSSMTWAIDPLPKEGIALAPFRDVGPLPTLSLNPIAIQEGLAGKLESEQGLTILKLDPPPLDPRIFMEPNSQLLPLSFRSKEGINPSSSSTRSGWLKMARDHRVKVLVMGTYEQTGNSLRLSMEAMDPFTNKPLFHFQVEGATTERLSLENSLAEGIAERLKPSQSADPLARPKKADTPDAAAIIANATGAETADGHYENGFSLTRRFDQTGEAKYLDGAIEEYRAALAIDPNHFRSLNNLGTVLHRKGNYEEALRYYQRVIELNPKYARAMENAAMAYKSLGKTEEAKEMWRKALENEDRPEVRTVIQLALEKTEEGEGGEK
jgi:TolA-binding protein